MRFAKAGFRVVTAAALTLSSVSLSPAVAAEMVTIDGSSTVYPITEAMAEEFQIENRGKVRVTVGISGTGGGFKKFCRGETDLSNASRPIRTDEMKACADAGIEFVELPVAFDALTVVINPLNDWAETMTVAELEKMWAPESQGAVTRWNQVNPAWPDAPMNLYGPGADSGTYDYWKEAIADGGTRGDFTASEDDNVLVQGVSQDPNALGFFGFAYYAENKSRVKAVKIDDQKGGEGAVSPSMETVLSGAYQPLARPIFVYVRKDSLERKPHVRAFVRFYLANSGLITEVGYIPLPDGAYEKARIRVEKMSTGTVFGGGSEVGVTVDEMMDRQPKG